MAGFCNGNKKVIASLREIKRHFIQWQVQHQLCYRYPVAELSLELNFEPQSSIRKFLKL